MLLDLDGFKDVNDTLGHAAGDSVLQLAAHRMRQALPASVMIGRLGGDEYAIVMSSDDTLELLETAQLILEVLLQPTLVEGIELSTNASIGITVRAAGRHPERGAAAPGRRGDVPGQVDPGRRGALRRAQRRLLPPEAAAGRGAAQGHPGRPAGDVLPAADRRRHPAGVRPGGAGALAAPAARAAAPDRVPAGGPPGRADAAAVRGGRPAGGRRPAALAGQRPGPAGVAELRAAGTAQRGVPAPALRGDRRRPSCRRRAWSSRSPRTPSSPSRSGPARILRRHPRAPRPDRHRRLRHRLLLAVLPARPAGAGAEDGPVLHRGDEHRPRAAG